MPKVIYQLQKSATIASARFEFPLEAVLLYLHPYGGDLLTWLQKQADARLNVIDLSAAPFETDKIVFGLIVRGAGTAFCPDCSQNVPATLVRCEDFASVLGMPGCTGGAIGRILRCPNEHVLLRVWDQVL